MQAVTNANNVATVQSVNQVTHVNVNGTNNVGPSSSDPNCDWKSAELVINKNDVQVHHMSLRRGSLPVNPNRASLGRRNMENYCAKHSSDQKNHKRSNSAQLVDLTNEETGSR